MANNKYPNTNYYQPNCEWMLRKLQEAVEILEKPEGKVPEVVKNPYYDLIADTPSTVWGDWNLNEIVETYNNLNYVPRDKAREWAKNTYGRLYAQYTGDHTYESQMFPAPAIVGYELPQATFDALGGVKAMDRGPKDNQDVTIDPDTGLLYTAESSAGHIVSVTPPEDKTLLWVDPNDNTGGIVDTELSEISENPVQNKVIAQALAAKYDTPDDWVLIEDYTATENIPLIFDHTPSGEPYNFKAARVYVRTHENVAPSTMSFLPINLPNHSLARSTADLTKPNTWQMFDFYQDHGLWWYQRSMVVEIYQIPVMYNGIFSNYTGKYPKKVADLPTLQQLRFFGNVPVGTQVLIYARK